MANRPLPTGEYNEMIRSAIRKIALGGIVSKSTGALRGTGKVTGFVSKIHDDEEDELFGTIDVQEYGHLAIEEEGDTVYGYHEGVLLTAIQNDNSGYVIIPKLYSEVLVAQDPETGNEYVTMFSHVDTIQLDSHETVTVGVTEREEYDPDDENSPDVHELEPTGTMSKTTYLKDSITTEVHAEKDKHITTQVIDGKSIGISVDDDETVIYADAEQVDITRDNANVNITTDAIDETVGKSQVKITDGVVYVGNESGTDDAVLGVALAEVLEQLLDALAQVKTTTQLGPQPFINLASFVQMKAKIAAYKGAHSGFLTQKVQIQK